MSTRSGGPEVYTGSQLFKSLSISTGLPLDQINFLLAQLSGLVFAIVFRKYLSYTRVSVATRQYVCLIFGAIIGYFCFGQQIYNLLILTTLSYIAILTCSPNVVQRVVLFVALMYLSYLHLLRLFHDYGGYTIDITGPIMIAVQKVTNVGFSLHDGLNKSDEELTDDQKRYAIRRKPTFLEYYSYVFQFHTLMCGPLVFYNDYIDFITGQNYERHRHRQHHHHIIDNTSGDKQLLIQESPNNHNTNNKQFPSPLVPAIRKLTVSLTFAVLLLTIAPMFPITYLADNKFLDETPFLTKLVYILCATCVARFKYYHAWILGEVICLASGLGFAGYDTTDTTDNTTDNSDGRRPDWELMSNIDIFGFENALNFRTSLTAWNKTTQLWLRRTAYDRNRGPLRLLLTYVLSALWHGFYPGYYLTFLGGAFFTMAARNVRRLVRPHFHRQHHEDSRYRPVLAIVYDCLTYLTTRIVMAYLVFPFVLLEFRACYEVYKRLYFFGHLLGLFAIVVLPTIVSAPPKLPTTPTKANCASNGNNVNSIYNNHNNSNKKHLPVIDDRHKKFD
ncbi:lysophospholipid acyltransferase 6-like [Oppia nitens]|uniref:lysophospholipid acyltransferase 6-like n=1 Tax=Oppia nitens TaxID=1686743 RepID=UPI0023DA7E75|nr:lysophospholipid acyltransferase 6-like [Oppia nitens]